jgi:hypothetical protein
MSCIDTRLRYDHPDDKHWLLTTNRVVTARDMAISEYFCRKLRRCIVGTQPGAAKTVSLM